jgi:hypothetical protein
MFRLVEILMSDLGRVTAELGGSYEDQYIRRNAVRTLAATVEGFLFSIKDMAHSSADFNGQTLTYDENKFLLERRAVLRDGDKHRFIPFKDNFKESFRLYAKCSGYHSPVDFNDDGFAALCETFELRDQLMHPKSYLTFCVTTPQTKRAGKAIEWVRFAIKGLIGGHDQKLNKNILDACDKESDKTKKT